MNKAREVLAAWLIRGKSGPALEAADSILAGLEDAGLRVCDAEPVATVRVSREGYVSMAASSPEQLKRLLTLNEQPVYCGLEAAR